MNENLNPENENNETQMPTPTIENAATTDAPASAPDAAKVQQAENAESEATSAVVKIEGQEFPLPVSVAANDDLLKTALSPHYPSIKNANISRETRAGQMIVSIVKRAEHKGWSRRKAKRA